MSNRRFFVAMLGIVIAAFAVFGVAWQVLLAMFVVQLALFGVDLLGEHR